MKQCARCKKHIKIYPSIYEASKKTGTYLELISSEVYGGEPPNPLNCGRCHKPIKPAKKIEKMDLGNYCLNDVVLKINEIIKRSDEKM